MDRVKSLFSLAGLLRPNIPSECEDAMTLRKKTVPIKLFIHLPNVASRLPGAGSTFVTPLYHADEIDIEDVRVNVGADATASSDDATKKDVDKAHDDVTIGLRFYRPHGWERTAANPAIYLLHGGAYVGCSIDDYAYMASFLAWETRCVVAAVEYRLAPVHPYPTPNDDIEAGYRYLVDNAVALRLDPARLACIGDSAGGHACLVLSQRLAAATATSPPCHHTLPIGQFLLYPISQLYTFNTTSYRRYHNIGPIDCKELVPMFACYFGAREEDIADLLADTHVSAEVCRAHNLKTHSMPAEEPNSDAEPTKRDYRVYLQREYAKLYTNWELSPLFSDSLHRQPYTYIVAAEFDALRDDAAMLAEKLEAAAVRTTYLEVASIHGFVSFAPDYRPGVRVLRGVAQKMVELFGGGSSPPADTHC